MYYENLASLVKEVKMLNHDKDAAYALCDGHTVLHLP